MSWPGTNVDSGLRLAMAEAVTPVREPGTLLEGRIAFPDERRLVDADALQRFADRRKCALAHAEDADFGGFDQRYPATARRGIRRRACARDSRL